MKFPAQQCRYFVAVIFFLLFLIFGTHLAFVPSPVFADTPPPLVTATPTPGQTVQSQWVFDTEITVLGQNADRARQMLWWVFSHPGIHAAPVLAQLWAFSRNIVYVFIVLVCSFHQTCIRELYVSCV